MDLDGTILDSMKMWDTAGERFLASIGKTARPGFRETVYPMTLAESSSYMWREYAPELSEAEIQQGVLAVIQHFYEQEVLLKPGAQTLLDAIWELGLPMAAATSSDRGQIELSLRRLGIDSRFRAIFTCTEVGEGKHAPLIYQKAAEFLNGSSDYDPGEFLVFEDALYCIKTAKTAGFRTCGVYDPSSGADWAIIRQQADIVLTGQEEQSSISVLLNQ